MKTAYIQPFSYFTCIYFLFYIRFFIDTNKDKNVCIETQYLNQYFNIHSFFVNRLSFCWKGLYLSGTWGDAEQDSGGVCKKLI